MESGATRADIEHVVARLRDIGAEVHVSEGQSQTVIGAVGDRSTIQQLPWEAFQGVERAVPVLKPYKFVSRDHHATNTIVDVGGVSVGGQADRYAGPCAVENRDQLFAAAAAIKDAGATILIVGDRGEDIDADHQSILVGTGS